MKGAKVILFYYLAKKTLTLLSFLSRYWLHTPYFRWYAYVWLQTDWWYPIHNPLIQHRFFLFISSLPGWWKKSVLQITCIPLFYVRCEHIDTTLHIVGVFFLPIYFFSRKFAFYQFSCQHTWFSCKSHTWGEYISLNNEQVVFSFHTALYLLGFSDRTPNTFHISVPQGYNVRHIKKKIHKYKGTLCKKRLFSFRSY